MKKLNLEDAPKVPFDLDGRIIFSSPKLEVVHLSMEPGQKIEPHANPVDVLFYIIEGDGTMIYKSEEHLVKEGMSVFIDKGEVRGLINHSEKKLRVLVSKIP
jgi:quercetin dioxygenase-like cupin family protein